MARTFNGTSDHIQATIGAFGSSTAFGTQAVIWKSAAQGRWHALMGTHDSAGSVKWALEIGNDNSIQGGNDVGPSASPTMTVTTANGWVIIVYGKGTGTVAPRYHKCVLSTATWTHENGAVTLANGTTPGATGTWRFGRWQTTDFASGQLALAAAWTGRNLSDTEVETLSGGLSAWMSLKPDGMWMFDQSTVGQTIIDLTGGGANQNAISGTTAALDAIPGFTYGAPVIDVARTSSAPVASLSGWGWPMF